MNILRCFYGLALFFALSSCSLPVDLSPTEEMYLKLHIVERQQRLTEQPRFGSLIVREAAGDSFTNSHRILFTSNPLEMGYYQFASWVEPPTSQFTTLLIARIEDSGLFRAVTRLGGSTVGDYQVNSEVLEFYHNIEKSPGLAMVRIRVELIDNKQHEMIARQIFEQQVPVEEFNSRGAVVAFSAATERILGDVVQWLGQLKIG